MSVGVELLLTIGGAAVAIIMTLLRIGYKLSKYESQITHNKQDIDSIGIEVHADEKRIDALELLHKDVDRLANKQREHERRVEGLACDVMKLSTDILSRFSEEIRPIRDSIELLTKQSIKNESDIENFKAGVDDIKETMREIKHDIRTRPCISHGVHMGADDVKQ